MDETNQAEEFFSGMLPHYDQDFELIEIDTCPYCLQEIPK